ncbi:hypothetical protein [Winogradskyella sp. PC D3.3]
MLLINEHKIFGDQKMLVFENISVSEIAFHLGFEDASYFAKQSTNKANHSTVQPKQDIKSVSKFNKPVHHIKSIIS